MLVTHNITGLFNGVSQQPSATRLDTQCEIQENVLSSVLDGITKRPPVEFVNSISSPNLTKRGIDLVHRINRDAEEKYITIFTGNVDDPVEVYTLSGTKCTVNYESKDFTYYDKDKVAHTVTLNAKDYLALSNPAESIRAVSVADYTFVLSKNESSGSPAMYYSAQPAVTDYTTIFYFKRGGLVNQNYIVYVNGVVRGSVATNETAANNQTDTVAANLYNSLVTNLGTTDWTISLDGSNVYLVRKDKAAFSVKITDSYGDLASIAIQGSVSKFTDLPTKAPNGYKVNVTGNADNNFDNYYVRFDASAGIWKETVKPGLMDWIYPETMPHKLVRTAANTFKLSFIDWDERGVGDLVSSPDPSFIGNTINDIFFWKNRLGLLSNDSIILSKAGDYFDFFPTTATDVLDDDPIDVSCSTNQVNIMKNALPGYNANLLVDSGQQQFLVSSGDNILSPKSITIDPTTSFETNTRCLPVLAGTNAYFATTNGRYSQVREYFLQPVTLINDAAEITAHVPAYLPANIIKMEASATQDAIVALSADDPYSLYIYRFYWSGNQKIQSAWSKWTFDDKVHGIAFFDEYLYMIQSKEGQVFISRINFSKEYTGDLKFKVSLDKQVALKGVYNSTTNLTTFTLPYSDSSTDFKVISETTGADLTGITKASSNTITVSGDKSSDTYIIGKKFTAKYTFSQFFVKDSQTNVANLNYRLQLRKLTLSSSNTGFYKLEVTPKGRPTVSYEYLTSVIGVYKLGTQSLLDESKDYLIMSNSEGTAISIVSDSFLPFSIQSAAWLAEVVSLSKNA